MNPPMLYTSVTVNSWLQDHHRDLHLILKSMRRTPVPGLDREFKAESASNLIPLALNDWLRQELPETQVGFLRKLVLYDKHYWQSWFLPYVDFSADGLSRYRAAWEGPQDYAKAVGFKCVTISYTQWRAELDGIAIHSDASEAPQPVLWFETPVGVLWTSFNDPQDRSTYLFHRRQMAWMRVQEIFSELRTLDLSDVTSCLLCRSTRSGPAWYFSVMSDRSIGYYSSRQAVQRALKLQNGDC